MLRLSLTFVILVFIGRAHEVVPGLGSLPLAIPAILLFALSLAWGGYLSRLRLVLRAPQTRLAVLLLVLAVISVPFALWPGGAASALVDVSKLWTLCILIPLAITTANQLSFATRVFAVAAALLVAGHVIESMLGIQGFTSTQSVGFDRNDVALFGAMGIPYALAWSTTGKRARLIGFGLAGFLVMGIIATGSRGGFLAMSAVGLVFLVRSRILSGPKKIALLVGALAVTSVAGSGEYWDRIGSIFSSPTEDYNFQSRQGRIEVWKRGLGYAAAHPITGVGFGNFPVAEGQTLRNEGYGVKWSTAHSAYVLVLSELGIPGIIVFLATLVSIFRASTQAYRLRTRPRGPPPSPAEAELAGLADATRLALLGYMVAAVFLSAAYSVAFLFLVSAGSTLHILRRRLQSARAPAPRPPARLV